MRAERRIPGASKPSSRTKFGGPGKTFAANPPGRRDLDPFRETSERAGETPRRAFCHEPLRGPRKRPTPPFGRAKKFPAAAPQGGRHGAGYRWLSLLSPQRHARG
jgi:hypothetical protein